MPYLIETWDKPGHQHVRDRARAEHLAYLDGAAHRLLACGAKLTDDGAGATGGVYILDTESREEAERFIAADPFSKVDLFASVVVTPWRKAYFNFERCLPRS